MNRRSRLAIYSGIYAALYSFCLYKNLGGATFPFFVIGTLCYIYLCTKEFSLTWKKDTKFFALIVTLIGISQPLTDKPMIHFFNIVFVFTLLIYIALHQFAFDEKWSFVQTFANIFKAFAGAISKFFAPIGDLSRYKHMKRNAEDTERSSFPWATVLISIAVTFPFVIIVILILSDADAVFKKMWNNLFNIILPDMTWLKVVLLTLIVFFFAYGLIAHLLTFPYSGAAKEKNRFSPTAAITAGIMFDVIYVIFCVIQILFLFIGKFTLPEGYSYAEYARSGFFQLLFICIINLLMVLVGIELFTGNKILKTILSIMCGCTYIMTASSAFRMILYIKYYYFTYLRVLVLWVLAVIAILLTGLLVKIWRENVNLFKFSFVTFFSMYILLAFSHLDYVVTDLNISLADEQSSFFEKDGYSDLNYILYETCLDNAPLVLNDSRFSSIRQDYINEHFTDINEEMSFREFNLSRFLAKKYSDK
ncbi:MAG: DUF4173 domain-containing protein [Lachnospiraceae bacterium]|nr:DUF4173 domain-containing protein [Lachnospiraceae bacterium]